MFIYSHNKTLEQNKATTMSSLIIIYFEVLIIMI